MRCLGKLASVSSWSGICDSAQFFQTASSPPPFLLLLSLCDVSFNTINAKYWSSVQIAVLHQNQFSRQLTVDSPFLKFTSCSGSCWEKGTAHPPWAFVHNEKRDPCQPLWCNWLISFKCLGAIRDRVQILQTFPKKWVHEHLKSTLACTPNISKNLGLL